MAGPKDWHAERYAAGEKLAQEARAVLEAVSKLGFFAPLMNGANGHGPRLEAALAEYERTKDAP